MLTTDEFIVCDVPPLPNPPVLPEGRPLAAETGEVADAAERDGARVEDTAKAKRVTFKSPKDEEESSSSSDDVDVGDDDDDEYSDRAYYANQKKREMARVARIASRLNMDDASIKAAKTGVEAVAAKAAEASKQRAKEAAAEHESYLKMFGDVGQVLYPFLSNTKLNSTQGSEAISTVTESGSVGTEEQWWCTVCELCGDADDLLICPCGNKLHRECAVTTSDKVPHCSRYCRTVV
uniref:Uncharacterized protein n=1 Tax=Trypanosoma congolense (strain IL3000) TaxID=1068625 RepID=G0UN75_TRYCI|nr:conserved hypothetical protein [Trypanosoma congolense IL3000]